MLLAINAHEHKRGIAYHYDDVRRRKIDEHIAEKADDLARVHGVSDKSIRSSCL